MKITLNLATRPYIELRPIYARLRVAMLLLAVLALPVFLVLHVEQVKAGVATARVNQLKSNIALLRAQQRNARALLQQPENAGVLAEADFLNELFRHKAFSWTATMSDLENTLPSGVQVLSIDPIVAPDGHVTIRLRVSGTRGPAVEVVRNLEHSRHFIAPRLASEALASQNNAPGATPSAAGRTVSANTLSATGGSPNDVAFDILAEYRPLPNSHDKATIAAERAVMHTGRQAAAARGQAVIQSAAPAPTTAEPAKPAAPRGPRPINQMFQTVPSTPAATQRPQNQAPQGSPQ